MKDTVLQDKQLITLRIEKNLLDRIDKAAKEEERDRTKQIIYIIKKYFELKDS